MASSPSAASTFTDTPTTPAPSRAAPTGARHPSPALLPVAIVHAALFVAGVLSVTAFATGSAYPSPFHAEADIVRFFASNGLQVRVSAFMHLGSAIPLGIFAASVVSRLRFLGVRAAGESIALYGGVGASLLLVVSGLCSWTLGMIGATPDAQVAVRALHLWTFAAGGPALVALQGVFMAGVSVTGLIHRLLPRWLAWLGLGAAAAGELATATFVVSDAALLVPLSRLAGLVWLIGVASTLPRARTRHAAAITTG